MKILIIGATGMVGHVLFNELKKKNINVIGIGRRKIEDGIIQLDLYTEWEQFKLFLQNNKFDLIINCSAVLINESKKNKLQASFINSFLPHFLVDLFRDTSTKIVHLSTGGVFSGNDDYYFEDSPLSPQTYYGITKAAGEFDSEKDLVVRSDFWGPDIKKEGSGLFNWFLNQQGAVAGYSNVFFNGISNIEFAKIIIELLKHNGIIHIGSKSKYSKYDFLEKTITVFSLDKINLIKDDSHTKNIYLKSNKNLSLNNEFDVLNHVQMIDNMYQYLMDNYQYYSDTYPQIF
jgi:dTDP-4-dehydrorhamnose reductase